MRRRLYQSFSLIFVSLVLACSEERALAPVPPVDPLVHEPWEDEEAEIVAFLVSGKFTAPRELYERVRGDLATIRNVWGDTIPELDSITVRSRFATRWITLGVTDGAFEAIRAGTYHDWDSLNALFGVDWVAPSEYYPSIHVRFSPRINICRVLEVYERLPGVRWSSTFGGWFDGPRLYALQTNESVAYVFRYADGDCMSGCYHSTFYYFLSWADTVVLVGKWSSGDPGVWPSWLPEAFVARGYFDNGDEAYRNRDHIPPGRVGDLRVDTVHPGGSVTLSFTVPGNDGGEGQASYIEVAAALGNLNEINWKSFPYMRQDLRASESGTTMTFTVSGLELNAPSSIAIRVFDGRGNDSRVSNVVTVTPV